MKRGMSPLPSSPRSPRACSYRSRRRRPAGGRHLPAGHTFTGTAHDLIVPEGGWLPRHRRDDHRDLIVLDNAGRRDLRDERRQGRRLRRLRRRGDLGHLRSRTTSSPEGPTPVPTSGFDDRARLRRAGRGVRSRHPPDDDRARHAAARSRRRDAPESVTIGHDFFASTPQTVQTGHNAPDTPGGPVKIGHDFAIDGSPGFPFVFDGLCNLSVGRDLSITIEPSISASASEASAPANGQQPNTIGRDLIVTRQHGRVRRLRALVHPGRRQPRRSRPRVQPQHGRPRRRARGLRERGGP